VRGKFREHSPVRVDLVAATRTALQETRRPYVIENVPGAPLIEPMMLCGLMFGLRVIRHRLFESNVFMLAPSHRSHARVYTNAFAGVSGFRHGATHICVKGNNFIADDARAAMGIDWMLARELTQAIPPAYTRWIGEQLIAYLQRGRSDPTPEGEGLRVWT
jgi:DNA (cytosine-5)-methyltransferase 1